MKKLTSHSPLGTGQLSVCQKEQISNLVQICSSQDKSCLSYPFEENCVHFFFHHQEVLTSVLCLFFPYDGLCECTAFTHPDFRRKGQFTALLSDAAHYLDKLEQKKGLETEFYFVTGSLTKQLCADTFETLKAIDAEYLYSEYMMSCTLKNYEHCSVDSSRLNIIRKENHSNEISCLFKDKNQVIGSCELLQKDVRAYIHHVEIIKPFRNKGYGTDFLRLLLWQLYCKGLTDACLQVSSSNQPAMALYKKTGFQICEILSYWLW